jgi:hypothetical protein
MKIIAVVGSRGFNDWQLFKSVMSEYNPAEIISGGARGADSMAAAWAKENQIPLKEIRPDYAQYGRAAPIRRNDLIVDAADLVVAFWDGKSRGTKHVIDYTEKTGKYLKIIIHKEKGLRE